MSDRRELFLLAFNLRNGLNINDNDEKEEEKEKEKTEKEEEKTEKEEKAEDEPLTIEINDAYVVQSPKKVESVKITTPYRGKKPKWETLIKKIFTMSVEYGDGNNTEEQIANYILMMDDTELSANCDKLGLFQLSVDYIEEMVNDIPEIDNDDPDNITTYKMGFALKRMLNYTIDVLNRSPIH